MFIKCKDLDQFVGVIARLTREGIGFRADGETLHIEMTGAF